MRIDQELGISYRQLDHYVRKGYLRPMEDSGGSGVSREFSSQETRVARVMVGLMKVGFKPKEASEYARVAVTKNDHGEITVEGSTLIVTGLFAT